MISRITIVLLLLSSPLVWGQHEADSLQVVQKEWKSEKLARGVVWKQGHFEDLFGSEQEINFVEIDLRKRARRVRIGGDPKELKNTSAFAQAHRALVAINGGFFDMKNGGAVDYIKVDGKVVNPSRNPSSRANAVFSIHGKKLSIASANAANTERAAAAHVMLSGPLLVNHGRSIPLDGSAFNANRHPRTAIAITKENKLLLLVVDGRNSKAHGMSLPELARIFRWLGASDAMNLDGGGSSTLFIRGKGVVNHPSDNQKFDHEGERKVANVIYLK